MVYIFTIIFVPKLTSNLCKNFFCIAWHQKPTVLIHLVSGTRPCTRLQFSATSTKLHWLERQDLSVYIFLKNVAILLDVIMVLENLLKPIPSSEVLKKWEVSYMASQMFCFRIQCLQNKTIEKPHKKIQLNRKVRIKFR